VDVQNKFVCRLIKALFVARKLQWHDLHSLILFCPIETSKNHFFEWGDLYLFIADFFASQIIGGATELVVLL